METSDQWDKFWDWASEQLLEADIDSAYLVVKMGMAALKSVEADIALMASRNWAEGHIEGYQDAVDDENNKSHEAERTA